MHGATVDAHDIFIFAFISFIDRLANSGLFRFVIQFYQLGNWEKGVSISTWCIQVRCTQCVFGITDDQKPLSLRKASCGLQLSSETCDFSVTPSTARTEQNGAGIG